MAKYHNPRTMKTVEAKNAKEASTKLKKRRVKKDDSTDDN